MCCKAIFNRTSAVPGSLLSYFFFFFSFPQGVRGYAGEPGSQGEPGYPGPQVVLGTGF